MAGGGDDVGGDVGVFTAVAGAVATVEVVGGAAGEGAGFDSTSTAGSSSDIFLFSWGTLVKLY